MNLNNSQITQVENDFNLARRRARFESILSALNWKSTSLFSLYEVTSLIRPVSETYKGIYPIELKRIIGSENRYMDFSHNFMPKNNHLRSRWQHLDLVMHKNEEWPPISVYEITGWYFVRDGNHRVSVAKANGAEYIDAEIVVLNSMIKISPDMTIPELKKKAVNYERNRFLSQYTPSYIPMGDIVFTGVGAYADLVQHMLVHKYFINQNLDHEISFEEGAISWYKNVYKPIVDAIREEKLLSFFPGHTEGDMYLYIIKRWDEEKKFNSGMSVHEVTSKVKKETKESKRKQKQKKFVDSQNVTE